MVAGCEFGEIPGTVVLGGVRIPEEILLHIFSFLDARSLAQVSMVCKVFYRIHLCENLWKPLAQNKFPELLQNLNTPPTGSWRIYYASKLVSFTLSFVYYSLQ